MAITHPDVQGYRVNRDLLKGKNPALFKRLKDGWMAYNDEVLVLDDASDGVARGVLIMRHAEIANKRADFEVLLRQAQRI